MKVLRTAKYHIYDNLKPIKIYYMVVVLIDILLILLSRNENGSVRTSGTEFATVVFLFVAGLNSFRSSFKFAQANCVSRKTFFKGLFISVFPITAAMSVIDLIINRIFNIFIESPTLFEMTYGSYYDVLAGNVSRWTQDNSFSTLAATAIWQFAMYTMAFWIGIFVTLVYYRSNKIMKIIVSVSPFALLILFGNIVRHLPYDAIIAVGNFFVKAFKTPYMSSLAFLITAMVLTGFSFLLTRRAIAK